MATGSQTALRCDRSLSCLLMVAITVLAGCGGQQSGRPATAPARGLITYKGEPVADAVVVLQPNRKGGFAASAMTDRDGKFDAKAFPPASGAVPGSYTVTVLKVSQEDLHSGGGKRGAIPQPTFLIPAKYADASKSELDIEVPEDGTERLDFDLKD